MTESMTVFNRTAVRHHRDRAATKLSSHDFLYMESAERLADLRVGGERGGHSHLVL